MNVFNVLIRRLRGQTREERILSELAEIKQPLIGWAFVQPLLSHSYNLSNNRRVITDKGLGYIRNFERKYYLVEIKLDGTHEIIGRKPMELSAIYVFGMNMRFIPLSPEDWKYVIDKIHSVSFPVEYRLTKHGSAKLTDNFKKICQLTLK
jgi:hypothetical protein